MHYSTVTSPCCMFAIYFLNHNYLPLLRALNLSFTPQLSPLSSCLPFIIYTTVTSPCCMFAIYILHQLPPLAACSPFILYTTVTSPCCVLAMHSLHHSYFPHYLKSAQPILFQGNYFVIRN